MWILRPLFVLILQLYYTDALLNLNHDYNNTIAVCIQKIYELYYKDTSLTFVHLNARDLDILQALHEINTLSFITRRPYTKITLPHRGYLIYTLTADDFLAQFFYLLAETSWMPFSPFLVVVERLEVGNLRAMFEELLRVHVTDVIIIDAITANIYTYDPFENYGCGKRFDRIIELGKCVTDKRIDTIFSPNKSFSSFRNCTLQVAATHWPPYTIDARKTGVKAIGMDEYLFNLLGELENIKMNYTYFTEITDEVSSISLDMKASGPLGWLQSNKFDVVTGCQILMPDRAIVFTYLCGHIAINEKIRIFVRQSGIVSGWKLLIRVFKPLVWVLLLLTFIVVTILVWLISKTKDKSHVIFSLIDSLLMQRCRIRRINELYFILLFWIVFACLIAYHYLPVLYSLTTKPIADYQIDNVSDMIENNMQACVSDAVRNLQALTSSPTIAYDFAEKKDHCSTMSESLESVATSDNLFTVVPYSIYYANRYKYYNKYGEKQIHWFRKPLNKLMYASYLYKGFPLYDKLNLLTMRVHAAGLTNKVWRDYDYSQIRNYQRKQLTKKIRMAVPWYIAVSGYTASSLCFLGEIITNYFKNKT